MAERSRSSRSDPGRHLQAQFLMMTNYTMYALRKQAQNEIIERESHKHLYKLD